MRGRFFLRASTLAVATSTLILTGCSTPQTRISEHPDLYQSLSHRDQAFVSQGQIRIGMSRTAVWLAWGSPDRKIVGNMGGDPTETWLYIYYATYYSPYAPWGPWAYFGGSFLRSILLFVHPTKYPLSRQGSYFHQGQSRIVPVRSTSLETKFLSHSGVRRMSIPAGPINGLPLISTVPRRS